MFPLFPCVYPDPRGLAVSNHGEPFTVSAEAVKKFATGSPQLPRSWPSNDSVDCDHITMGIPTRPDGWPSTLPTATSLDFFNRGLAQLEGRPLNRGPTFEGLPTLFYGQDDLYLWSMGPNTVQEAASIGMKAQLVRLSDVLDEETDIHPDFSDYGLIYRRQCPPLAGNEKISLPAETQKALQSSTRACVLGSGIRVGGCSAPVTESQVRIMLSSIYANDYDGQKS